MQCNEAHQLCNNYRGQVVRIFDKSGNEHVGRITKVTDDRVFIEPVNNQNRQNSNSSNNRYSNRNRSNMNRNQSSRNFSERNYSNRNFSERNHSNRSFHNEEHFDNRFDNRFNNRRFDNRVNRDFRRDEFGCGFWGCGLGVSIAIGFIAGVALAALFFF